MPIVTFRTLRNLGKPSYSIMSTTSTVQGRYWLLSPWNYYIRFTMTHDGLTFFIQTRSKWFCLCFKGLHLIIFMLIHNPPLTQTVAIPIFNRSVDFNLISVDFIPMLGIIFRCLFHTHWRITILQVLRFSISISEINAPFIYRENAF